MFGLFNRKKSETALYAAYNVIVAQARHTVFYTDYRVPDTTEGRFENIVLHMFLLLHRLKPEAEGVRAFGQGVFDLFFLDMDRSLREAGVGDLTVPKRIKSMAEAFYGRIKAYDEALSAQEPSSLQAALGRFLYTEVPDETILADLAGYVRKCETHLAKVGADDIVSGRFTFPPIEERNG